MDSNQNADIVGKPSRLPAGSTLEIAPGVNVPHPHAEVNLPGAGDPRLGATDAVTEKVVFSTDGDVTKAELVSGPLADEVKPRRLTTADDPKVDETKVAAGVAATPAKLDLKQDPANKVVEVAK